MSKMFKGLVSYTGKYYSTAYKKANGDNEGTLVFAKIANSPKEGDAKAEVDGISNVGRDGYYIFTPGLEGHLVDMNTFKDLHKELKELIGSGELEMPKHEDGSYYSIVEYANSRLGDLRKDNGDGTYTNRTVKEYVDDAVSAVAGNALTGVSVNGTLVEVEDNVAKLTADTTVTKDSTNLVTSGAVEAAIANLGTVMDFKGVVEGDTLPDVSNYNAGDVVVWKGEEYVLSTDNTWHEIGQVKTDEAVLDLSLNASTLDTDFASFTENTKVTVDRQSGTAEINVELDLDVATTKEEISAVGAEDSTDDKLASAKAVKEYVSQEVGKITIPEVPVYEGKDAIGIVPSETDGVDYDVELKLDNTGNVTLSQSASGLKADVTLPTAETLAYAGETLEGESKPTTEATNVKDALDDLFKSDKVTSEALVDLNSRLNDISDAVDAVTTTIDGDDASYSVVEGDFATGFTVKNTLATADAAGLATDTYVKDYVAEVLAWEVLTD